MSLRRSVVLGLLPFLVVVAAYLSASHQRHAENPADKLLPTLGQMADAVGRLGFQPDPHTGEYLLLNDTGASLKRIGIGVGLAALAGLLAGLNMGLLPRVKALFSPFLTFASMVPPLAILPILFIALGVDEVSKVTLIFIGVFPVIARDIHLAAERIPREQVVKAFTLGASQAGVIYRVVTPQMLPRLIDAVRLSLGAAWLFLIAAEAIASTEGLGYRIFLMRRYLAMDVILPYVLWITALGFAADWLLRALLLRRFRWYVAATAERMSAARILHIEDLYKEYGEKLVLENVDLSVRAGDFCSVVGPSGCGKSTLFRLILGQETPSRGRVLVDGVVVEGPGTDRGIVYQRYSLYPHLSVLGNVTLGRVLPLGLLERTQRRAEFRDEGMRYLERVGLAQHAAKYPHELSGGMQQRVAIAQALLRRPKVLMMDEPFGALDPETRENMQLFLLELWEAEKMTIFFVTHDMEEALFLGTRVLVLSQYYTDDRGGGPGVRRGARIVADYNLENRALATRVKRNPRFLELQDVIRRIGFSPEALKHVTEFDLRHPDAFQTLTAEEARDGARGT